MDNLHSGKGRSLYSKFPSEQEKEMCGRSGGHLDLPLLEELISITVGGCFTRSVIFNHRRCRLSSMGQILGRFGGEEWRKKKLKTISDRIFEKIKKNKSAEEELSFEELYIATLLVFNDINKLFSGTHLDPPSREHFKQLIAVHDTNKNTKIDKGEFFGFMEELTSETFKSVSQKLVLTLVIAPTIAVFTKKRTEGVPGVGKLVQKLPSSAYASIITLAAVLFQSSQHPLLK
ncbi:hypothetical protein SDJN03_10399, partial [Cucurbita argyrosperma subsp. sororia]